MNGDNWRIIRANREVPAVGPYPNLAALLFQPRHGEQPGAPLVLGTLAERHLQVSLGQLRNAALHVLGQVAKRGLKSGDTVCLIRLPRTSETVLSVAYAALSAGGFRVLLPMYLEKDALAAWLSVTGSRAVFWSRRELLADNRNEADQGLFRELERAVSAAGVPALCLDADLGVPAALVEDSPRIVDGGRDLLAELAGCTGPDTECLVLSTSGSSGQSKLVRYRQGAILRSCAAWEAAGLFRAQTLGGRALTLLFAHSMGIRAFWNAIWTHQAICLIPPEWFIEHAERTQALLVSMKPEHITGGPAVFRTLLEFARIFPELKHTCLGHLKHAVSSGACFDPDVANALRSALGLPLDNAFGMTETMQVLSTLVEGPFQGGLGNPLPGVALALEPVSPERGGLYRLHVRSPFGYSGYLGGRLADEGGDPAEWLATGDLVQLSAERLLYAGREADDFFKDAFGVKVSSAAVMARYAALGDPVAHLECFPNEDEPGLAAIVFLSAGAGCMGSDPVRDRATLDRVQGLLEARNEQLQAELDDFELRHLTIGRFLCIGQAPPRTPKGNVARSVVAERYAELIRALTGRFVAGRGVVALERTSAGLPASTRLVHPLLGNVLRALRLDKHYHRGSGDRLWYTEHGKPAEVVDFVGGFGANLLGHMHPQLIQAGRDALEGQNGVPLSDQGSERPHEGALARRLALEVGRYTGGAYVVRFGSTGAEAIEMALAHAFLERRERFHRLLREQRRDFGAVAPLRVRELARRARRELRRSRPTILVIEGAFHGHSLGARSALGKRRGRVAFAPLLRVRAVPIPPDGEVALDEILDRHRLHLPVLAWEGGQLVEREAEFSTIIAALAEPVLGEGGVRVVSPELLRRLEGRSFPLIIDEIQCGLGRTGAFLASSDIRGNYYAFGKALGGGIAKISALLIDRRRYVPAFDRLYSSTFAGDAYSCAVAQSALDVVTSDDVPRRAAERGRALASRVEQVRQRHPGVLQPVSGRGLMLGVRIERSITEQSMLLRMAAEGDYLGLLASAYLLNRHGVRVLPTLSAPETLRLEPSAYVDDEAIERLASGLGALADALRRGDTCELVSCLVDEELKTALAPIEESELPAFSSTIEPPAPGAVRVAFLNHFTSPARELAFVEPTLRRLPPFAREALFNRLSALLQMKATVSFARNLFGGRVWFASIVLPVSATELEELHRSGRTRRAVARIQEALNGAARMGCSIGALGAYTSIISRDGLSLLPPEGMRLTTGNALTAAAAARRLLRADGTEGTADGRRTSVGVVGATGNIGSAVAGELAHASGPARRIVLLGRDIQRLEAVRGDIVARANGFSGDAELVVSTDLGALRTCDTVVVAASTTQALVCPHHLNADKPVLVADISVPSAVSSELRALPNVRVRPLAGALTVPGSPDFAMAPHIPPGTAYSCAAEAMLLALEPTRTADMVLVGRIRPENARALADLAEAHGMLERSAATATAPIAL